MHRLRSLHTGVSRVRYLPDRGSSEQVDSLRQHQCNVARTKGNEIGMNLMADARAAVWKACSARKVSFAGNAMLSESPVVVNPIRIGPNHVPLRSAFLA